MGAIHFSADPRLLAFCARELPIEVFVETGTFQGDTLRSALPLFEECHSVELSEPLYEAARKRFQAEPSIHLHLGGSAEFLRTHRERFARQPVAFWLDAHWCVAENTAGQNSQSPLLEELDALGRLNPQSMLMIDDARLYTCPPPAPHAAKDWPDFQEVLRAVQQLSPQHRLVLFDDVMVFYPESVRDRFREFCRSFSTDWFWLAKQAGCHEARVAECRVG